MKSISYILMWCLIITSCKSQNTEKPKAIVGGPCQGCEAVLEYPDRNLNSVDTIEGFLSHEPKLRIEGIVYQLDGKTPAADVVVYIYHTNKEGLYTPGEGAKGWGMTHGMYRGWVKTDKDGKYTFYTFRPGAYPNGAEAEHVHITVKEPGKNEYYIDSIVFDDDPLLTDLKRKQLENRGGNGIVTLVPEGDLYVVKRDIKLGLNIPDYY